jgi:HlyD family secretion protein
MGRIVKWLIVVGLVAGGAIAVWTVTRPKPVAVVVRAVDRGAVERTVANTKAGTVNACRRAKLSPSIGGQVASLPVKEGDWVAKGQLLLELWNQDLAAQVLLAEREVAAAQAHGQATRLKAQVAMREAQRLAKLRQTGAASEEKADRSLTEAKALEAEATAADTTVNARRAQLAAAQAALARTRLAAPFDGVVAEINSELFEYVTPSPVGIPTPPAVDLIDTTCFYVTAPIDEVDAAAIRVGMTARISLDAFGDRRFVGSVRRIAAYVLDREKQARTVDVEAVFDDAKDLAALLAGYSADIEVVLDVRPDVVRVPTEAVMDGRHVFIYLPAQKRIQERHFTPGLANWDFTEVREGLTPGQQVVVNVDSPDLKDGAAAVVKDRP